MIYSRTSLHDKIPKLDKQGHYSNDLFRTAILLMREHHII